MEMKSDSMDPKMMLMEKAQELKMMADKYDIPLEELLGGSGMEMGKGMMGEGENEDETEIEISSPDIEKAIQMMKAMRA